MGLLKYLGNKLLSLILFILSVSMAICYGSSNTFIAIITLIIFLSAVYFWKHNPFK